MEEQKNDKDYGFGLIVEHLTGSASDELQQQLEEWRNASDENEQLFVWMEKMWRSLNLSDRDKTFDKQRAYRLFCERVEAERVQAETYRAKRMKSQSNRLLLRRIASCAAILIPMTVLSYFTYLYFTVTPAQVATPLYSEVTVPSGSKIQMTLQDGTKVWLNSDSYLQHDSEFGRTNRLLTLTGEAYFEVAKDENSPFIVDVGGIKVKVHGTHFNVNAYKENNGVAVTLLEGSVEMITPKNNTMLEPGHVARYDATTKKVAVAANVPQPQPEEVKASKESAVPQESVVANTAEHAVDWIDNRLVFNGETFEQIIATLERSYNVKVNIQNVQVKKRRFAGDFINNETIEQILNVMSVNGKFRYSIKGNVIDIY